MSFFKNFINQPGTKVLAIWASIVAIGFTIGISALDGEFNPAALYFACGGVLLVLIVAYLMRKNP